LDTLINIAVPLALIGVLFYIPNTERVIELKMDENNFTLRHTKFWLVLGICFIAGTFFIIHSTFQDYDGQNEIIHYLLPLIIFLIGIFMVFYYFSLIVKIKDDQLTIRKNIF